MSGAEAANYDITYVAGTLTVEEDTAPTDVSQIDNVVYPLEKEACTGGQAVLSFNLKNTDLIRGFEFDLYLPAGVTVVRSDGDIEASLTQERMPGKNSHSLSVSEQPDGSLHFLCSAFDNKNYAAGDSEVMTLKIKLSEDMAVSEYAVVMRNVILGKTNINQYYETGKVISRLIVDEYMLGDVNGDGIVNLTDYIWTANHIHKNASEEYIFRAGDINGDGTINLLDYIGIANIIHYGSPYGEATAGAKATVFEEADEAGVPDPQ